MKAECRKSWRKRQKKWSHSRDWRDKDEREMGPGGEPENRCECVVFDVAAAVANRAIQWIMFSAVFH